MNHNRGPRNYYSGTLVRTVTVDAKILIVGRSVEIWGVISLISISSNVDVNSCYDVAVLFMKIL